MGGGYKVSFSVTVHASPNTGSKEDLRGREGAVGQLCLRSGLEWVNFLEGAISGMARVGS